MDAGTGSASTSRPWIRAFRTAHWRSSLRCTRCPWRDRPSSSITRRAWCAHASVSHWSRAVSESLVVCDISRHFHHRVPASTRTS